MKKGITFSLLLIALSIAGAQSLFVPMTYQTAMHNGTRSVSGMPGRSYWQNAGDYTLHITFNPKTRVITGTEDIQYHNNSPDTLDRLVIHLFPDLYKKGATATEDFPVEPADMGKGVTIKSITINNSADIQGYHDGTNYIALPPAFIAPHSNATVHIEWSYVVNKGSHIRTGMVDGSSAFLAYTFPRIAVYDDIYGWDQHIYNGLQEFYNDFGSFDAEVTVPKNFVVWATGDLLNPEQVFQPQIVSKLQQVMTSDSITFVITKEEAANKNVTAGNKWNTFHFHADGVSDFAFAVSDHYVWQSSSLNVSQGTKTKERRVRIDAAYNPDHHDYEKVAKIARQSIDIMSHSFPAVPYPYPHETVFDGLDQMEYPMMVNDNPVDDTRPDAELYTVELTSHEIFHTYFPFYMGINETKNAWMDEGWATLGEHMISKELMNDPNHEIFMLDYYKNVVVTDKEMPMITSSDQLFGDSYWESSYGKPALMYYFLMEMMGEDKFLDALHHYMESWQGKHPQPMDFMNCINNASGKNYNWYFKQWLYDTGYPDLSLLRFVDNGGGKYSLIVYNDGYKPIPVDVTITFADNSTQHFHANAGVWEGNNIYYINFNSNSRPAKAVLNELNIPDVVSGNNVLNN